MVGTVALGITGDLPQDLETDFIQEQLGQVIGQMQHTRSILSQCGTVSDSIKLCW